MSCIIHDDYGKFIGNNETIRWIYPSQVMPDYTNHKIQCWFMHFNGIPDIDIFPHNKPDYSDVNIPITSITRTVNDLTYILIAGSSDWTNELFLAQPRSVAIGIQGISNISQTSRDNENLYNYGSCPNLDTLIVNEVLQPYFSKTLYYRFYNKLPDAESYSVNNMSASYIRDFLDQGGQIWYFEGILVASNTYQEYTLDELRAININIAPILLDIGLEQSDTVNNIKKSLVKNVQKIFDKVTKTYTNTQWGSSKKWYIRTSFTGNSDGNVVNYVTTWGTTEATNTQNQFSSKTFTLTADNYTKYKTLLTAAANTEIAAAQKYLDIPDLVLPSNYSATYTKNGFKYTLAVTYTKVSGEKNKVVVASTIDGGAFGTNSTLTYTTQALANTGLATEQSNRIAAMKTACDKSPANSSETYTKNGLNFTIAKQYVKNAGNTTVTVKCLLDGTQYSTDTQAVTAANASNLTACTTKVNALVTTLKNILNNSPANTNETYSKGNMNFTVTKTYTKTAGNATATWVTKCDGIQYGTGTQTIGVSDPGANITTLSTTCTTSLDALKTAIDGCPTDASEVVTVNGFKYNLGTFFTKTAGTTKATGGAKLDGNIYGSTESTFSVSTWAANKTTLTTNANNHKASCRAIIDTSPANSAATYTVNGLSYNVATEYSKAAGNSTATIKTKLDNVQQKSQTQSVSVSDLANNIGACSTKARTDLDALKAILDQSPADYDQTQHTIDGFLYTAGATFTKAINSSNVTVKIYCDGEVDETYTDTVGAASTANDIAALKADALAKVNTLVGGLQGLPADSVNYTVNGFNFVLLSQYAKNYSTKKLTIHNFIDGVAYGTPYNVDFDRTAIATYAAEGLARIEAMKTAVAGAPANTTSLHSVNGFNFNVGTNFEKALGSTTVYVKTMLDGAQTGTSSVVTYDVSNVAAITSQAASDVAALKVALNASPANYANTHTKSGFGWRTGVNFSKAADSNTVTLQTTLDGDDYGNAVTQTFDVTNITALSTKAAEMESALNTILTNVAPADTAENFTIRRFNFNIESCFVKTPGIKTVTTMVKLDGTQYDTYHQEDFNVNTATSLDTYNNNLINTLKSRLTSVCPDDIHTTYSRNQFNFVIDAYFSKQPNTDVIDIEYNIDSADLVTNS